MRKLVWSMVFAALAILVAVQVTMTDRRGAQFVADADVPTVAPGVDVLDGIPVIPARVYGNDYRRAAFGESWTDDTTAPGGYNGCDTRNDILHRDLVDKVYTSITRCPAAVLTGTLYDPYTNVVVAFTRGNQTGASVQIDHLLSAAVTADAAIGTAQHAEDMPLTGSGRRR